MHFSYHTVRIFHFYRFDSLSKYTLSSSNAYHDHNSMKDYRIYDSTVPNSLILKRLYSNNNDVNNSENLISGILKTEILTRSQSSNSNDIRSVYSDIDNLLYYELLRQFEHLPRDINISRSELFLIRFQIERNLYSFSPMRLTKYIKGDIIPSNKYKLQYPDGNSYLLSITPNDYLVYQTLAEALISYSVAFKYVSKESYLYNRSKGDEFTILLNEINSWIGLDSIEYYCLNYESLRRMPKDFLGSYLLKMFYQGSRIYSLLHSFIYAPIIDSEGINYNNMIGIPPVYPLCSVLMNLGLNLFDEQYQGLVLDQPHLRYLNQILIPVFGETSDKSFDEALKVVGLGDVNYTTDIIKRGSGAIYLKPRGLVRLNNKGNVTLKKNFAYLDDIQ